MRSLILAVAAAALASAQLVTIQGTDTITSSRAVINSNFSYLNTIKSGTGTCTNSLVIALTTAAPTCAGVTEAMFGGFTDITTANATTSKHGLLPKLSSNAAQYLNGAGAWATPPGGVSSVFGLTGAVPNLSGDASTSGSAAVTFATVNSAPGACGDSTHVCAVTTNGKGLVISQSAVLISGGGGSGGRYYTITRTSNTVITLTPPANGFAASCGNKTTILSATATITLAAASAAATSIAYVYAACSSGTLAVDTNANMTQVNISVGNITKGSPAATGFPVDAIQIAKLTAGNTAVNQWDTSTITDFQPSGSNPTVKGDGTTITQVDNADGSRTLTSVGGGVAVISSTIGGYADFSSNTFYNWGTYYTTSLNGYNYYITPSNTACTATNLTIYQNQAGPGAGQTATWTLYDVTAGAATALTVPIVSGGSPSALGAYSDTTHSVSMPASNVYSMKIVSGSGYAGAFLWSFKVSCL